MTEPQPAENGYRRDRPRLPIWIAISSIVIALIAGSLLVYVLYKETRGPGEILREFARRVDRHDCEGSYELLDASVQGRFPEDAWCSELLPEVDENLDSHFTLEQAVLEGDVAEIEISGVGYTTWRLQRFGDRSWRVVGPQEGLPVEAHLQDSDGNRIVATPDG
jgi:hypothetical protein